MNIKTAKTSKNKFRHGFTILELIIIMAIIAVFVGFVAVRLPSAQSRAQDTQRIKDLEQYTIALGKYSITTNGIYPVHTNSVGLRSLCGALGVPDCPDDPDSPTRQYLYQSNADGTEFVVWAELEVEAMRWGKCSNGSSGNLTSNPVAGSCPLAIISPTATPIPPNAPTSTPVPTANPTATPLLPTPTSTGSNIINNGNFSSGTAGWLLNTDGNVTFAIDSAGFGGTNSALVSVVDGGTLSQLYQTGFTLVQGGTYTLSYRGRSLSGNDFRVAIVSHSNPSTNYGLNNWVSDYTNSWQLFTRTFTVQNVSGSTTNTRLMFYFNNSSTQNGDQFWIDDVTLVRL